jgi:hypothetical protein
MLKLLFRIRNLIRFHQSLLTLFCQTASSFRRGSKAKKTKREADNVNDTAASEKASAFVPKKVFQAF